MREVFRDPNTGRFTYGDPNELLRAVLDRRGDETPKSLPLIETLPSHALGRSTNALLRDVLRAKSREPYLSETIENPMPNEDANALLREVVANGGSMQSRRDSVRDSMRDTNTADKPVSSDDNADQAPSLNDLLRHLVVGSTAEEAI